MITLEVALHSMGDVFTHYTDFVQSFALVDVDNIRVRSGHECRKLQVILERVSKSMGGRSS